MNQSRALAVPTKQQHGDLSCQLSLAILYEMLSVLHMAVYML